MSHAVSRARPGQDRASIYQEITDKIIAELEAGRLPWVQPWGKAGGQTALDMPRNAATQRRYSGINVLILWGAGVQRGDPSQTWLTFRQALGLGGNVRKGEHGTTVVYADRSIPGEERTRAREDGDEPNAIHFLKRFTVFNVAQCEGLPDNLLVVPPPLSEGLILPEVEALIRASGADLRLGGNKAFYAPALDYIQVPRPEEYYEPVNWHRTALHELGHWSGAAHRLGRDLSGGFGSKNYAREELVAEMTAAFTCATLGITPTVRHADYIGSWLDVLREDERLLESRDIFSVFVSPEAYRVMAEGGRVIGQVPGDNPFSPGEMLMLAGRRWRIIEVDGKRRELSVRPAKGGKPPLFPGDPKPPAEGVVQQMRRVWEDLAIPAYLDATAKQHLMEARTTYDRLGLRGASVARHDGQLLLFPWVGDRRQQALVLALTQAELEPVPLGVAVGVSADKESLLVATLSKFSNGSAPDAMALAALVENKEV